MYERIILIIDNRELSDPLTEILLNGGFTNIYSISSESELTQHTGNFISSLFIIDSNFPNVSHFMKILHKIFPGPPGPYLILSDDTIHAAIEPFLLYNPLGFIRTPVNPALFTASVKNACQQHTNYIQLHESEEQYRTIVETSMEGILILDDDFHFVYVNPSFCAMIGKPCHELIGKDFRPFVAEESRYLVIDNYKKRQQDGTALPRYEFYIIRPDGTKRCIEIISTVIHDAKGRPQTVAILLDITERIKAREALIRSDERYQLLVESASEIILVAQDSIIVFVNNRFVDFTGYTKDEACGMSIMQIIYPDDRELVAQSHIQRIHGKAVESCYSFRAVRKNGDIRWAEINAVIIEWEGRPATLNFITDITDKKNAEIELLNSNRNLQEIINFLPDPTFAVDLDGRITIWNHAMELLCGMHASEVLGQGDYLYAVPFYGTRHPILIDIILNPGIEDEIKHYNTISHAGNIITAEVCVQRNNVPDEYFWASASPLYNFRGEMIGAIETVKKITDKKLMENELIKSLNEKDILLKEVHHRVKNNMQIISSILNLQGQYITDENDFNLFVDCKSRIQSMALVHEHLYRSDNLAKVVFPDYIKTLIQSLSETYGIDTRRISITSEIERIELSIDLCIPCALLINEIVSNSLKHAFPDNMTGNINILFSKTEQNMYVLTLSDTGIGFQEAAPSESNKTLGLQLIQALTSQLNASVEKSTGPGTTYTIHIPSDRKVK